MKKYKSLYIIGIFVLTAIIIACAIYFRFGRNNIFSGNILSGNIFSGNTGFSSKSVTEKIETGAFDEISINAEIMQLEFATGDDFHIEYKYPDNIIPEVSNDNGELKVRVKGNNGSVFGNSFKKDDFKFVIYAPANTVFDKLSVDVDAGSIRIDGFGIEKVSVESDAANIEMSNVAGSDNYEIKADAGNIELKDCVIGNLTVDTEAGNVELTSVKTGKLSVDTEAGNIQIKKSVFTDGNFDSELGNIEVKGNFESITAKCSLGAIDVDSDNLDSARFDLGVKLGSIKVGGELIKGTEYKR